MKVNKKDLADRLSKEYGLTLIQAKQMLDYLINEIKKELKEGNQVDIANFGNFSIAYRSEREGVNPLTKKKYVTPAKNIVKFKAGKQLKEFVR